MSDSSTVAAGKAAAPSSLSLENLAKYLLSKLLPMSCQSASVAADATCQWVVPSGSGGRLNTSKCPQSGSP